MGKLGPSGNNGKRASRKANYRRRMGGPKSQASPVTITHADGTVEKQPAYSDDELRRIHKAAQAKPRTWNEINSTKGGGRDFGHVT